MNFVRISVAAVAVLGLSTAGAVTKHYSFSNGYPTTTTRQTTGATVGASESTRAGSVRKVEEKTLVGKVTRVDSGDVIWVTPTGGRRTKVRLVDADAPEQGQPYGVEAKKFLFDLVKGKDVTVRYWNKDRAGAILGTVFLQHEKGLVDVNLTMIQNGCAWYVETKRPATGKAETSRARAYASAFEAAKSAKRGLWSGTNPDNPAEWRKLRK